MQALQKHQLPDFTDERGSLFPVEFSALPFIPKRMFVVNAKAGQSRGAHAHMQCIQYLICTGGQINLFISDSLGKLHSCLLNVGWGILIPAKTWTEQLYHSTNPALLVICSEAYDEDDYIRDYDHFKQLIK